MNFIKKHPYTVIGGIGLFVTLVYVLVWNPKTLTTDLVDEEIAGTIKMNEEPILLPVERIREQNQVKANEKKQVLGANERPSWERIEEIMKSRGFSEKEADYMTDVCSTKQNGKWCAMLAYAVAISETGAGERGVGRSHKNNLFSIANQYGGYRTYVNRMASFEDWVEIYDRLWYKNDCADMVYKSNYVGPSAGEQRRADWVENCEKTIVKFYQ